MCAAQAGIRQRSILSGRTAEVGQELTARSLEQLPKRAHHTQALSPANLQTLAQSRTPAGIAASALEGSLPPAFVAQRSLDQLAEGRPVRWCATFYMLRNIDHMVAGSRGFKDAPLHGRIEIGYGITSTPARLLCVPTPNAS